jgi:peptidoglycan hydrolase CwlO-like protein
MLFRLRDLLWLLIVVLLAAISLVEYRAVANFKRLLSQKESELTAAESELKAFESSEARLKGQINELQEALDGYKYHVEMLRRFLLTKPQR